MIHNLRHWKYRDTTNSDSTSKIILHVIPDFLRPFYTFFQVFVATLLILNTNRIVDIFS